MAKPVGCQHRFCLSCLEEWSDFRSTCPYCRKNFGTIEYGLDEETGRFKFQKKVETRQDQDIRRLQNEIEAIRRRIIELNAEWSDSDESGYESAESRPPSPMDNSQPVQVQQPPRAVHTSGLRISRPPLPRELRPGPSQSSHRTVPLEDHPAGASRKRTVEMDPHVNNPFKRIRVSINQE